MNKLFTKIVGAALGLTMAIGVGVAVASNSMEATPVQAAGSSDWVQVTALSGLNTTDTYVIANDADKGYYMNGTVSSGHFQSTAFSASAPASATAAGAFKLEAIDVSNNIYKIKLVSTSKYVYATKAGSGGGSVTGSSDSSGWKFLLSGTSFNAIYQTAYSSKYAAMRCYSNTSWRTYSNNSATSISTTSGTVFRLYKYQSKTLSSITLGGTYDTEFTVGDTFNHTGMTVTANYSDSTTATVTGSATWSSPDMSTSGTKQVTVSYTESGTTKTASYNITVNPAGTTYTVTNSISNATLSSTAAVAENDPLNVTITPDSHYSLPTSLTSVTMGGNTLTAGSGYTYNSSTGAFSIASVTGNVVITGACVEDAKYTVTYVAGDHGSGSNYVVNNQYAGSYTLATFATAGFSADSGYSFKKWSVGGVEYAEEASITLSANTTVTAVYEEVTTYTIVTDASTLKDGTTFVLVGYISSTYYVTNGLNSGHVLLTSKTAATTISNGVESGSTLVSTEAQVLTLEGSTGAFKIKYGDSYLKFTGTSNGNDSFDTEANASTFSASMSGSYILFTCTSSTGEGRVWRMNTSSKDMRNYATSSGVGDVYMFANIPASNELDSVTTSGQTASFTAGNKWSYGGTLTAHYTLEADATVTPTSFKYGASGINPTTAGTTISTSTTLDSTFNGKYIYVVYTEDEITKWASYQITVNAAPATSVTLSSNSGSVALEEVFNVTSVTATVNPSAYATQGVTWEVYDSDGLVEDDTYMFDGTEFYATEPADVVFHVKANSNSSIYATYTLTISGDPIVRLEDDSHNDLTNGSTSVFADAGDIYFEVSAENFEGTITYTWSSSNTSVISIDDGEDTAACMFYVETSGSARLSCHVVGSTKGNVTVYVDVTVSAVTVTSVTWNAPTINVYSGATLSTTGWNVRYSTNSGKTDQTPDSFDILLGGSVISNGYAFAAADDGKTLAVRVGETVSATTTTVSVTQTLQAVMASDTSAWDYTFSAKVWSAAGEQTIDGKAWTMSGTGNGYWGYDGTKGQQFGSGSNPYSALQLSSSDFSGTIESVTVYTSGAKDIDATVQVSVGGTAYGAAQSITASNAGYTFDLGGKSGTISIDYVNDSSKAIYVKEIVVNTVSGSHNIANVAGHEAAQKAVVKFAKAFNTAMDTTSGCTTNMSSAWTSAKAAWTTFESDISGLSESEQTYAKNLIKYATVQWTSGTDSDYSYCLERCLATYEKCVTVHGQEAFMADVRTFAAAARITPLSFIVNGNGNTVAIIVIISMISVTAIGGYFFLRKRKEQ